MFEMFFGHLEKFVVGNLDNFLSSDLAKNVDHIKTKKKTHVEIIFASVGNTHIHTRVHTRARTHTHTHTHIYIYIYISMQKINLCDA